MNFRSHFQPKAAASRAQSIRWREVLKRMQNHWSRVRGFWTQMNADRRRWRKIEAKLKGQIPGLDAFGVASQNRHAPLHPKTGLAGVAWIEIENAVDNFAKRLVGMTKDHDFRFLATD